MVVATRLITFCGRVGLDSLEAGSRDDKIKVMLDNPVHPLHDKLKHIGTDGPLVQPPDYPILM